MVVKTSKSLDVSLVHPLSSLSENKLKNNMFCISLESVFTPPPVENGRDGDIKSAQDDHNHYNSRYHVPGIGSSVPDDEVKRVLDYFQKCAADNGGYLYDFDIENYYSSRLDAIY